MGPRTAIGILVCTLTFCGCTHKLSLEPLSRVQLGATSAERAAELFGEPRESERRTTPAGAFVHTKYQYFRDGFAGRCLRLLTLEYRNDTLNAFLSASSCQEEVTMADLDAADALMTEIGTARQGDVQQRLGEPSGRALCPTLIHGSEASCQGDATEIWYWMTAPDFKPRMERQKLVAIRAVFDSAGALTDLEALEE